jgi:hypothetical protein
MRDVKGNEFLHHLTRTTAPHQPAST